METNARCVCQYSFEKLVAILDKNSAASTFCTFAHYIVQSYVFVTSQYTIYWHSALDKQAYRAVIAELARLVNPTFSSSLFLAGFSGHVSIYPESSSRSLITSVVVLLSGGADCTPRTLCRLNSKSDNKER